MTERGQPADRNDAKRATDKGQCCWHPRRSHRSSEYGDYCTLCQGSAYWHEFTDKERPNAAK
jgi:hypothetical protein